MGLRLRLLWLIVTHPFGAPVRWLERRTDARRMHERELARIQAEAHARVFEAIAKGNTEMVRELAQGMTASAKVMQTWLEGFKTTEVPSAQVVTEASELRWEAEQLEEDLEAARKADRALHNGFPALPAEMSDLPWASADGRLAPPIPPPDFA